MRPTFHDRRIYVNIPIGFPEAEKPPQPADFHAHFADKSAVVLLWGEGGSGKTTLACHLAHWALADKEHDRLCKKHRMIPVFIEENLPGAKPGDSTALLDVIGENLKQMTGEFIAPANDLVKKLLEQQRILLIVDGYSELNAETL